VALENGDVFFPLTALGFLAISDPSLLLDGDSGGNPVPPASGCFDDLKQIHEYVKSLDGTTPTTVALCANTVFDVGSSIPLYLRSNVRYQCTYIKILLCGSSFI